MVKPLLQMFFCGFSSTLTLLFEKNKVNLDWVWIPLLCFFTGMETGESWNTGTVTETKCSVLFYKPLLVGEKSFGFFPFELYKYSFKN